MIRYEKNYRIAPILHHPECFLKKAEEALFVLDNMITFCHLLSTPEDNLWEYALSDGTGIRKGIDFRRSPYYN